MKTLLENLFAISKKTVYNILYYKGIYNLMRKL